MSRIFKVYLELEDWKDSLTLSRHKKFGKAIEFDMELPEEATDNLMVSLSHQVGETMKKWWRENN